MAICASAIALLHFISVCREINKLNHNGFPPRILKCCPSDLILPQRRAILTFTKFITFATSIVFRKRRGSFGMNLQLNFEHCSRIMRRTKDHENFFTNPGYPQTPESYRRNLRETSSMISCEKNSLISDSLRRQSPSKAANYPMSTETDAADYV